MRNTARRVLLVNLSRDWGGGEVWHFNAAHGLRGRGWEPLLLVFPGSALAQRAQAAGLETWALPVRSTSLLHPGHLLTLWRRLRRWRPGTVILNASHELKVVGLLARLAGVPRVLLRRGIPVAPRVGAVNRWYLRHVLHGVLVNSRATAQALEAAFPDEMRRLPPRVIYNGVDPAAWPAPPPRAPGAHLMAVGRLEREKGMDLLLDALALLRRSRSRTRLTLLGDGSQRAALVQQAAALGIADAVDFAGHVPDVAARLAEADVLVLPSRWEGFGYVMVEAMLLERPVVAFDITATREVVVPEETGLLVPPEDVTALAEALAALLAAPDRMIMMGQAGRRRALAQFTLEAMLDQLEQALVLDGPTGMAPTPQAGR